ncbi:MAG: tetratricopeptide repeat protein, partial [Deltaproteobacteria bacterium]|nr:tetratricopeptide repeat protein [Deltaproteobacteria bacterium]
GTLFLSRQDIPRAKEFYTKALSLDPNEFIANYRMGFLLYQAGQRDQAQSFLRKVVRSEPSPLYAILTVAHAWEMLGDQQKALSYYRKALDLNPSSARIQEKVANLEKTAPPLLR